MSTSRSASSGRCSRTNAASWSSIAAPSTDSTRFDRLIGGTGTGKSHLAIAIARSLIRSGARGRFFNVVDLVNRLETEHRADEEGRIADYPTRLNFVVPDELGYLPFAQTGANSSCT